MLNFDALDSATVFAHAERYESLAHELCEMGLWDGTVRNLYTLASVLFTLSHMAIASQEGYLAVATRHYALYAELPPGMQWRRAHAPSDTLVTPVPFNADAAE